MIDRGSPYYDFARYGRDKLERESGQFTEEGYISYHGVLTLEELMMEDPAEAEQREEQAAQGPEMGGMA